MDSSVLCIAGPIEVWQEVVEKKNLIIKRKKEKKKERDDRPSGVEWCTFAGAATCSAYMCVDIHADDDGETGTGGGVTLAFIELSLWITAST